ncbi:porin family protein [Pedobacter frigoris]|uniref:porin family protein n=1 Tax=Pedobacter frigoris TaxID=2571272 RepID=UPI00292FB4B4|nr:porin family protein [Pedobacter frigoris]
MKKLILTISLIGLTFGAFAQLGIDAGVNLAKYKYAETTFDVERKTIMSYNFGLQYKKSLTEKLYLLPELSYTVKGTRIYYIYPIGFTGPMKRLNRLNYIQLTIPAIVALPVNDEYDFEIGAAPFLGYLSGGKSETVEFDDSTSERKFNSTDFKKMDAGLQFLIGFRLSKKLGFHFKYDWGLANVQYEVADPNIKTRNVSFNMSWIFAKND